ncbi:hypothetical protein Tco_1434643, partial [Tanacetum coccineum]
MFVTGKSKFKGTQKVHQPKPTATTIESMQLTGEIPSLEKLEFQGLLFADTADENCGLNLALQ